MSFIYSFGSSSKGNSTYIGDENKGIIIDCGIGVRSFFADLNTIGISQNAIKGIFITHEHTDHIKAIKPILKKINPPIYATKEVLSFLIQNDFISDNNINEMVQGQSVDMDDFSVECFNTPHDSVGSVGYVVSTSDNKKVSICTDLGYVNDIILGFLKNSNVCLIESNYDENMLEIGEYPWFLKKRIASNKGHLSNNDCANTIEKLLRFSCDNFLLSHLSQINNQIDLAVQTTISHLKDAELGSDYRLNALTPKNTENTIHII